MGISFHTWLIVCPLVFLAGMVDAIGGGGGLISLPAYLMAGVPPHYAIATNKLSSACGTALATVRFVKEKLVDIKLAVPTVFIAILGSSIGAHLSLLVNEKIMFYILLAILPVSAFLVLNKKLFPDHGRDEVILDKKTYITSGACAFFLGMYDGFYGPGTGTFIIIAFTVFVGMSAKYANAQAKVINLTTNITSLTVFILNGKVLFLLGLGAAVCNMLGAFVGSGLVIKNGSKIVRPSIIFVLVLLGIKIVVDNM